MNEQWLSVDGVRFEQAKSKRGQVTLLRAASMAVQATACGQLANVNVTSLPSPRLGALLAGGDV